MELEARGQEASRTSTGLQKCRTGNQYQGWVLRTVGELNKHSQVESKWAKIKSSCLEEAIVCGLPSLAGRGIVLDWVGRVKGQLIPQGCILQEELCGLGGALQPMWLLLEVYKDGAQAEHPNRGTCLGRCRSSNPTGEIPAFLLGYFI